MHPNNTTRNTLLFTNMKTFLLCTFLSFTIGLTHSFGQSENEFIRKGDNSFKDARYKEALSYYEKAYEINPDNVHTSYRIGILYLEDIYKFKALPYLEKVANENAKPEAEFYRYLGYAYHFAHRFDEAEVSYKKYLEVTKLLPPEEKNLISRKIEECENGKFYMLNKLNLEIVHLGEEINTPYADYAPIISTNEASMIFTSRRPESIGGERDENDDYYEDIYVSYKKDDQWQQAKPLKGNVNTIFNEAGIGFSKKGDEMYIYRHDGGGDVYSCTIKPDSSWTDPLPVKGKINKKNSFESAATVSSNGKHMFFTSDKIGGFGSEDIYYSDLQANGTWGEPVNMGSNINTPESEEGPFLDFDDKTLYFSSTAHKGMGGYDIYKTTFDSTTQKWSDPINMGYPINSANDDVFFTLSGDGSHGYFSSVKPNGFGEKDIYMIVMPTRSDKDALIEKMKAMNLIVRKTKKEGAVKDEYELEIKVKDEETGELLDAELLLSSSDFTDRAPSSKTDNAYLYNVPAKKEQEYTLVVKKKGFAFATVNFVLSAFVGEMQEVKIPIVMKAATPGKVIQLKNIYYNYNQYVLKETSYPSLNNLLDFMRENPTVKIELASHTDSDGDKNYNMVLSQKRAQSVVKFLIANGIDKKRVVPKGYGSSKPIASNDDEEEGKELNRRTEFKILK